MDRRLFLAAALGSLVPFPGFAQQRPPMRTRWKVRTSLGFDAIAFLGPLSGESLYRSYYAADADAFAPRLPEAVRKDSPALWQEAGKTVGLLGPSLSVALPAGADADLETLIATLAAPEARILPAYKASRYWSEADWRWYLANLPRLRRVFEAMRDAGFAAFRAERTADIAARAATLEASLGDFDVIRLQERVTGRTFDPEIEVVLLHFCKPHGIKVQGQRFLQAADWNVTITVRNAAHEMLHPPVAMDGAAAKAALAMLAKDPLIPRIVKEHDPRWGYTTLEGIFDEDLVEALDQLISERLGVARNPADRWRQADDGIHVLAAGFYALLRQDKWIEAGGSIEQWLADAAAKGRLAPDVLHPAAARVLERPVDRLWPLPTSA